MQKKVAHSYNMLYLCICDKSKNNSTELSPNKIEYGPKGQLELSIKR